MADRVAASSRYGVDNRFSIIPHWVIFSGISSGAIHLYAILAKYADNDTGQAFPARSRLANDAGKSVDTIDRATKELVEAGALKVTQRKRKDSKENYSNLYTLITANPCPAVIPEIIEVAAPVRPGGRVDAAENKTHQSKPTIPYTSELRPDQLKEFVTSENLSDTRIVDNTKPNPGNLTPEARKALRQALQRVGQSIKDGHKFHTDRTQDLWWGFTESLEMIMPDEYEGMADLIENGKWTVSAAVANPYAAGRELNTLINTAAKY